MVKQMEYFRRRANEREQGLERQLAVLDEANASVACENELLRKELDRYSFLYFWFVTLLIINAFTSTSPSLSLGNCSILPECTLLLPPLLWDRKLLFAPTY